MSRHAGISETIIHRGAIWEDRIARWICLHDDHNRTEAMVCGQAALSMYRKHGTTPPGRDAYNPVSYMFNDAKFAALMQKELDRDDPKA